ncbi:MAG: YggS family pyridoxal phosphate-dependent enzyme [Anaerolineales bacterium]
MSMEMIERIRSNLRRVEAQMADAAARSGRQPGDVRLVVVTKTHPVERIRAAIEAGATILGENYAEEAVEKIQALGPQPGVAWHMIGHVQSRKAGLVAAHFAMLHSLDSVKLAGRLDRFAGEAGRVLPVLLEVNLSGEESKYGFPLFRSDQEAAFFADVEAVLMCSHLSVRGLMTMPPFADDPEESRPYFRRLAALRDHLAARYPQADWRELSMGTSVDFAVAVEEGATLVRVGTAILGARV